MATFEYSGRFDFHNFTLCQKNPCILYQVASILFLPNIPYRPQPGPHSRNKAGVGWTDREKNPRSSPIRRLCELEETPTAGQGQEAGNTHGNY